MAGNVGEGHVISESEQQSNDIIWNCIIGLRHNCTSSKNYLIVMVKINFSRSDHRPHSIVTIEYRTTSRTLQSLCKDLVPSGYHNQ